MLAQVQKDEHELSSASLDGKKELIQEILKTKHWWVLVTNSVWKKEPKMIEQEHN